VTSSFPPRFATASTCLHNPSIGRIAIRAYGENKEHTPYEEFRKLFEQRPEPSSWQRIRIGSATKWALAGGLCVVVVLLVVR